MQGNYSENNLKVEPEKDLFESFDLERFLYVLKRSKWWILSFIVVIVTSAYLYVRYTKPLYKSESIIKLEFQSEANVLGLVNTTNTQELNEISGEIELIKSKLFFSRVAEASGLDVSYHVYGRYLTDERYKNSPFVVSHKFLNKRYMDYPFDLEIINDSDFLLVYDKEGQEVKEQYRFGEGITTEDFNFLVEKTKFFASGLKGDFFFTINSQEALINYLSNKVEVVPENLNAKTIKISLVDYNRYKARDLVNLIDVLYISYTEEVKNQALEQQLKFLDEQIEKTEEKLQEYENYFEKFTIENRTTDLNQDLNKTIVQLSVLDSQRFNLNQRIVDLDLLKAQIESDESLPVGAMLEGQYPKALEESLNEYTELRQERELKSGAYNETSYIIQQVDLKLEKARLGLMSLLEGYENGLSSRLNLIKSRKNSLESNLSQLPSMRTEFGKTNRVYTLEEEFMLSLQQSKIELEITRAGAVSDNVILSSASLPYKPIKPEKFLILAASVVLGIVFGIIYLLIRYLAHNKIAGVRELEKLINVPLLGSVPRYNVVDLDMTSLVVDENSKSSISESLRTIRTNMDFINAGNGTRIISITSTVPGEGKTFIATNLGAIIGLTNQKVCVLDLDMRKPKVHLALGGALAKDGMSTLITGKSSIEASIQKTSVENLFFIPSGPIPPNPSELLLQKDFTKLLDDLKKRFDVIILDTPPVGLVTDAKLAMAKSDIQLYVVRADYSRRSFSKVINDLKASNQFSYLTVVLNSVSFSSGYGYGYGGYSPYGGTYYEDPKKIKSIPTVKNLF
ncbi:MAG: polysaccharide biosynthesis tyrosine autokinase [Bacteroidota bacterium]